MLEHGTRRPATGVMVFAWAASASSPRRSRRLAARSARWTLQADKAEHSERPRSDEVAATVSDSGPPPGAGAQDLKVSKLICYEGSGRYSSAFTTMVCVRPPNVAGITYGIQYSRRSCQSARVPHELWQRSVVSDSTMRKPGLPAVPIPERLRFDHLLGTRRFNSSNTLSTRLTCPGTAPAPGASRRSIRNVVPSGATSVLTTRIVQFKQDGRASERELLGGCHGDGDHLTPAAVDDSPCASPPWRRAAVDRDELGGGEGRERRDVHVIAAGGVGLIGEPAPVRGEARVPLLSRRGEQRRSLTVERQGPQITARTRIGLHEHQRYRSETTLLGSER